MQSNKKDTKAKLHPRNRHREQYNFNELCHVCPELYRFVTKNKYGNESIDYFNRAAVKMLNCALLKKFYKVDFWNIPDNYLAPPVPGRADYIHYLADLLNKAESRKNYRGLDIGVGANCIYPIIGVAEYGWSFVGTDIDTGALESAGKIIASNSFLAQKTELRLQENRQHIFSGIIREKERFDFTICNPPFHTSADEAEAGSVRKLRNLKKEKVTRATLNFGGKSNELWCDGGEVKFITNMIKESKQFYNSCRWFTTLVSKEANLKSYYKILKRVEATEVKTIPMKQGNKVSRILAWSFSTSVNS